jgi:hypothetical protein
MSFLKGLKVIMVKAIFLSLLIIFAGVLPFIYLTELFQGAMMIRQEPEITIYYLLIAVTSFSNWISV